MLSPAPRALRPSGCLRQTVPSTHVLRCFAICPYVIIGIFEAMACELPVICTDACHFPEAATQGGGWDCEVSVDSVADALLALISSSDSELADRGHSARRLAEQNYTWDKLAKDLHNACHRIFG